MGPPRMPNVWKVGMEAQAESTTQTAKRPRIFYGWYIVGAGMGVHLWTSIVWIYGMQLFFTPIKETFGWSSAAISGAFSLQRLEGSIITPAVGFLVDRYGPRKLVFIGGFFTGLGLIFLGFIQELWMFYVGVLIISMGTSGTVGVPRTWAIVQWFRRRRGLAMGIGSTGAVISGPLLIVIVWLINAYGWRTSFIILGLLTWVIALPLSFVYRTRPEDYGLLPDGDLPEDADEQGQTGTATKAVLPIETSLTVRQALRTQAFWILVLVFTAQTMGVNGLNVHLIPYLVSDDVGFSTTQAASVLGVFTMLSVFGRLGGGIAMDYVDKRVVLAGLLACQAAAFWILANLDSYWQVFPYAFLYGTAFGGMMPSRSVIISSFFGRTNFGAIQGLAQSGTIVGGVVAPILLGYIFDVQGTYVPAIYILMIVALAAIPLTLLARAPKLVVQTEDS